MQGVPLQEAGWDSDLPGVPLRMDGLVQGEQRYVDGRNISVGSFPTGELWPAPHIHQAGGSRAPGASGAFHSARHCVPRCQPLSPGLLAAKGHTSVTSQASLGTCQRQREQAGR